MPKITQVKLVTEGGAQMTTWVDADPKLKRGAVIELKKDKRMWLVEDVYATQDASDVDNRGWDNNNYDKHTGLGL